MGGEYGWAVPTYVFGAFKMRRQMCAQQSLMEQGGRAVVGCDGCTCRNPFTENDELPTEKGEKTHAIVVIKGR